MVIDFSLHHIRPLIIAAGYHTTAGNRQGVQIVFTTCGILDPHNPRRSLCVLRSGGTDIAAYAEKQPLRCVFRHLLGSPALGDGSDVQPHFRVGKIDRRSFLVKDQLTDIRMLCRFFQSGGIRQGGILRIVDPGFPGFVPQL